MADCDRVEADEDGYLWLRVRADNIIVFSSGYRIGPVEVAAALGSHPAVEEAAAVAAPDPERGSVVRAVVVLRAGYTPSDELVLALQDYVKAETAPYRYPRVVDLPSRSRRLPAGRSAAPHCAMIPALEMEFLVRIDVRLPPTLAADERKQLLAAELDRGRELVAAGTIASIWRVPGGLRNVGVWRAADATELHAALTSLPLFPYLDAEVTPLAAHPLSGGHPICV